MTRHTCGVVLAAWVVYQRRFSAHAPARHPPRERETKVSKQSKRFAAIVASAALTIAGVVATAQPATAGVTYTLGSCSALRTDVPAQVKSSMNITKGAGVCSVRVRVYFKATSTAPSTWTTWSAWSTSLATKTATGQWLNGEGHLDYTLLH